MMEKITKKHNWVFWVGLAFFTYFIFHGVLSYMMASGVEVYVIKYDAIEHKITFEHIIDDGEHGNKTIEEEVERNE